MRYAWQPFIYPRERGTGHTLDLDDNLRALRHPPKKNRLRQQPTTDLGGLDALPLELLWEVLSELDLDTLTSFRHVNRRARYLLRSHPQYKAITTHARNALRGILGIRTGQWISLRRLYEKLCIAVCEQCGDFGGYLYLLTCKRVCFICLSRNRLFVPIKPDYCAGLFGLSEPFVMTLPHMQAMPGRYGHKPKRLTKKAVPVLVDYESALVAALGVHGSFRAMHEYLLETTGFDAEFYDSEVWENAMPTHGRRGIWWRAFGGDVTGVQRFVAIVSVPWLDQTLHLVQWGFHCRACEGLRDFPLDHSRIFTAISFEHHLEQCGDIRDGKHQPD